jgi:hypothetical protein
MTTMNKKIIYTLIGLALVFFVTSLFIFLKSGKESRDRGPAPIKNMSGREAEEPSTIKVKAFFFVEASRFMQPAPYEFELSGIREEHYLQFLQLLLKGEGNYITPVPAGVALRSLYVIDGKNMMVIDFTEELVHKFPAGTSSELEFIYFFVNNICFNFKEIKKVKFLVSGNEYRTLSGHIDIENSFYPDFRFLRSD